MVKFIILNRFCGLIQVESYNLENLIKTTYTLNPMQNKRSSFTPISVGNYIYAFGGINKNGIVNACER